MAEQEPTTAVLNKVEWRSSSGGDITGGEVCWVLAVIAGVFLVGSVTKRLGRRGVRVLWIGLVLVIACPIAVDHWEQGRWAAGIRRELPNCLQRNRPQVLREWDTQINGSWRGGKLLPIDCSGDIATLDDLWYRLPNRLKAHTLSEADFYIWIRRWNEVVARFGMNWRAGLVPSYRRWAIATVVHAPSGTRVAEASFGSKYFLGGGSYVVGRGGRLCAGQPVMIGFTRQCPETAKVSGISIDGDPPTIWGSWPSKHQMRTFALAVTGNPPDTLENYIVHFLVKYTPDIFWAPDSVSDQASSVTPAEEVATDPKDPLVARVESHDRSRENIREIQRLLAEKGYDPGPADGFLGPRTRNALNTWKTQTGRTVSTD